MPSQRGLHIRTPRFKNSIRIKPEINGAFFLSVMLRHAPHAQGSPELTESKPVLCAALEISIDLE